MALSPTILAALLSVCAPNVDPHTATALIAVESDGNAWALHENAPNRSYAPRTYQEAYFIGTQALSTLNPGDSLDVGLMQVNSRNFASYGVTLGDMLDPCTNLKVGSAILATDYRREWAVTSNLPASSHTQTALRRALQDYNSGSPTSAPQYTAAIIRALDSRLVQLTLVTNPRSVAPVQATLPPTPAPPLSPLPRQTRVASAPHMLFRNLRNPAFRDGNITTSGATSSRLPGTVRLPTESAS